MKGEEKASEGNSSGSVLPQSDPKQVHPILSQSASFKYCTLGKEQSTNSPLQ